LVVHHHHPIFRVWVLAGSAQGEFLQKHNTFSVITTGLFIFDALKEKSKCCGQGGAMHDVLAAAMPRRNLLLVLPLGMKKSFSEHTLRCPLSCF
jgi:hypothetical protein